MKNYFIILIIVFVLMVAYLFLAPSKTELYNINLSGEFPTFAQELTKIEEKKNLNDLSLGEINNISNKVNYCQGL